MTPFISLPLFFSFLSLSLPPSLCLSLYIYILCINTYMYIQTYTNDDNQAFQTTYPPGIPPWLLRACPQRWWCAHGAPFRRVLGSLWNLLHSAVICMYTYIYIWICTYLEREICVFKHEYMYLYIYMYTRMYICKYTYVYVCMYVCLRKYAYIYE